MTTKIKNKTLFSENFAKSPKQSSKLSKKTDITFQEKLELKKSPILNESKREFEYAFPSPPDASSANSRIAQINFPSSPKKMPLPPPVFEDTPLFFAKPKHAGSLFAGLDAVVTETNVQSMPFSDFSDFLTPELKGTESLKLPQTPMRKAPVKRARLQSTTSLFQKLHEALYANTFKYSVTYLATGSYFNVYTLDGNEETIIPGVDNSELVFKAFHGEKSGFEESRLREYLRNAIKNYHAVKAAGLPVAEIYNADTAVEDGYIIQRKVSGKVDPLNDQHMLEVQKFFEISLNESLVMDLLPQNFGLENGHVVLFDFVEDPMDVISVFHKHAIEYWLKLYRTVCLKKDQAADFLNKLSANHYQDFVKEQIERVYWD